MQRLWQACGIKHLKSTAYHPETNCLVKRFNGILLKMFKVYVAENPNNWDEKLQPLLYAYWDVPQESPCSRQFFFRRVRGPLDLLSQNWETDDKVIWRL